MSIAIKDFLGQISNDIGESGDEYYIFCPFHYNINTPSFYINKKTGLWLCHNSSCGKKGRYIDLVRELKGTSIPIDFNLEDLDKQIDERKAVAENFDNAMDRILINYRDNNEVEEKLSYLINRGFKAHVMEYFEIGLSERQNRIVLPVRNEHFKVVGFIGRALDEKNIPKYKYSKGFPRGKLLLNLHNAKAYSSIIIVEGSLDPLKVHQAGFPNVVSTMGSNVTNGQIKMLNKYFNQIIIFSDNDSAGEGMKSALVSQLARKDIYLVQYTGPEKDAGEMSEDQIVDIISSRVPYLEWKWNQT
jgi:DNA primase